MLLLLTISRTVLICVETYVFTHEALTNLIKRGILKILFIQIVSAQERQLSSMVYVYSSKLQRRLEFQEVFETYRFP